MRLIASLMLMGLSVTTAMGQTPKEYAQMAQRSWSAFECAALSVDQEEKKRLFKLGYDQGMLFLYSVKTDKVEGRDLASVAPWPFSVRIIDGQRPDFILGMIWEAASTGAFQYIKDPIGSDEWRQRIVTEFKTKNCDLL